jgi:hypothetical protein
MYKKPNIKDPNANFQRLTMRKKHFSHAKKHQYTENNRNAFYHRMHRGDGQIDFLICQCFFFCFLQKRNSFFVLQQSTKIYV